MQYNSTRNHKQTASPAEAVLRGIAPDGGLYLCDPAALPLDPAEMLQKDFAGMAEAVLVLPVRGDGATLERALHLTMEQRATGETPILLADCGLDETGLRLAQSLTQRYSRVQLCPAEELENYLK